MLFEVMIPPSTDGKRIGHTVVVEADNWLVALREGVAEMGLDPRIERRGSCEIRSDHSVTVTDAKRGQVLYLRLIARLPDERWADADGPPGHRIQAAARDQPADERAVIARCSTEELDQIVSSLLSEQPEVDIAVDVVDAVQADLDGMAALHGDVDRAANLALEVALRHVPSRTGWVMLLNGGALVVQAARGSRASVALDRKHPTGQGMSGHCATTGQASAVSHAADNPLVREDLACTLGLTPSSVACVPVRAGEVVRGVLQLLDRSTGAFTGPDLVMLGVISDALGQFILEDGPG